MERFEPCALKTVPILKEKIWGGERLRDLLGKPIPEGARIGESWEVSDCGGDSNAIAAGPYAGRTLRDILARDPEAILGGRGRDPRDPARLPLLLKFLDAREDLSVQVHPSEEDAARIGGGAAGKVEAWLVLAAGPGARIAHGVEAGCSWSAFFRLAREGAHEARLRRVPARAGDVFFNPAGTIHALGAGIVVAEIQESSDTTYRISDGGRAGPDGRPRPLHLDEAERVTPAPPVPCPYPTRPAARPGGPEVLVACPAFRFLRYTLGGGRVARGRLAGERFALLTTIEGEAVLAAAGRGERLGLGESFLLPAALGAWAIRPRGRWVGLWMEPGEDA